MFSGLAQFRVGTAQGKPDKGTVQEWAAKLHSFGSEEVKGCRRNPVRSRSEKRPRTNPLFNGRIGWRDPPVVVLPISKADFVQEEWIGLQVRFRVFLKGPRADCAAEQPFESIEDEQGECRAQHMITEYPYPGETSPSAIPERPVYPDPTAPAERTGKHPQIHPEDMVTAVPSLENLQGKPMGMLGKNSILDLVYVANRR